ncbi:MAG: hypothetical protein A2X56_07735 [Nitrospirae bacterium GWC2_57_13]|nr:MAG: hypothetical protein A2X56_07735 [Nitrospirae bacterium GWC2_57_13]HAS54941.1 hypothetical protein [Nitrospiraceae bacterium]
MTRLIDSILAAAASIDYRRIFAENWGIKLFSLLLTISLWFFVTSKGKMEMSLTAPLELRNIPKGMAVVGDVPGNLEVRVHGQERLLRDITAGKKVAAVLDLSFARTGENILRISPEDIQRPTGVSVTRITPYDVKVRLELVERRTVEVKPRLRGAPAVGYTVMSVIVNPPRITVEGPRSAMDSLFFMHTMPIDISGLTAPITVDPKIEYLGKPVKVLEKGISVRIVIERKGR